MKKRKTIRSGFLFLHRWLGLVSGLVILVVSTTGCLYVFEEEWRDIFQHKYLYVNNVGEQRKPLTELTGIIQKTYPEQKITNIRFLEKKNSALVFFTRNALAISINPYNGAIIGHRNLKTDPMTVILDIHLNLFMGQIGARIIRWNVLIFFIMCISGLILWWPKQKRFLKRAVTIKWKTRSWKRLNWGLHSVLGFYALFILLIVSLTGMFWVFDKVRKIVSVATQSSPRKQPQIKSTGSLLKNRYALDSAYQQASNVHAGARLVFISIPSDSINPIRVLLRYPYAIVQKQTVVSFDQYSGAHLHTDDYRDNTSFENVNQSIYDFHTGRINALGLGSKIIYFLASLFAASLPITGFLVWYGRKNKTIRKSENENVPIGALR